MRNIILVGFMGSGKSSLGIRLSYRFKQIFLDTDAEIEKGYGDTITNLFAKEGEAYFRQLETECIRTLWQKRTPHIVSTGGGIVLKGENREMLKNVGLCIYLKASPETIYERVKEDTGRPLLQKANPQEEIRRLLEERKELYEEVADLTIDVDEKEFLQIVQEIEEKVNEIIGD